MPQRGTISLCASPLGAEGMMSFFSGESRSTVHRIRSTNAVFSNFGCWPIGNLSILSPTFLFLHCAHAEKTAALHSRRATTCRRTSSSPSPFHRPSCKATALLHAVHSTMDQTASPLTHAIHHCTRFSVIVEPSAGLLADSCRSLSVGSLQDRTRYENRFDAAFSSRYAFRYFVRNRSTA